METRQGNIDFIGTHNLWAIDWLNYSILNPIRSRNCVPLFHKSFSAQSAQDFDAKSIISEQEEFFTPMISEAVSETSTLVGSRESLVEVGVVAKKERSFSVVEQEQLEKTLTEIANQQK